MIFLRDWEYVIIVVKIVLSQDDLKYYVYKITGYDWLIRDYARLKKYGHWSLTAPFVDCSENETLFAMVLSEYG